MAKRNRAQKALEDLQDFEFGDSGISIGKVLHTFFKDDFRNAWSAGIADEDDEEGYVEVSEGDCLVQFEAPIDDTSYRFVWVVDQEGSYGLVYLCVDDDLLDEDDAAELMETFGQQYQVATGGSSKSKAKRKRSSDDDDNVSNSHFNFGNANGSNYSSQDDEDEEDEDYDEDDEDDDDEDYDEDDCDCDDDEDYDDDDCDCDDDDDDDDDEDDCNCNCCCNRKSRR